MQYTAIHQPELHPKPKRLRNTGRCLHHRVGLNDILARLSNGCTKCCEECTFETLRKAFQLKDPRQRALGNATRNEHDTLEAGAL